MASDPQVADLADREPESADIVSVLSRRGVLTSASAENGETVARGLARVLDEPRFPGADPRHIFWALLERLYDPASNTQRIAIPFTGGDVSAETCVSAAMVFVITQTRPGEYIRMVEQLTRPLAGFTILRPYPDGNVGERIAWLSGFTRFDRLDYRGIPVLRIHVEPDPNAAARAVEEQRSRRYQEYDFGSRNRKNTRLLPDVMIQSALTNYAMGGRYDSAGDCERSSGARGLEFGSVGDTALREDMQAVPAEIEPRGSLVLTGSADVDPVSAIQDRWTGGHYLEPARVVDIG